MQRLNTLLHPYTYTSILLCFGKMYVKKPCDLACKHLKSKGLLLLHGSSDLPRIFQRLCEFVWAEITSPPPLPAAWTSGPSTRASRGPWGCRMSWDPWSRPVATLALSLAAQARARRACCLAWRWRLLGGRSSLGRENRPTRVVAPPLGWRFHRGVSPRKPPKSQELRGFGIVFPNIVNMSSGKLAG